jgi:hypothetical protein
MDYDATIALASNEASWLIMMQQEQELLIQLHGL